MTKQELEQMFAEIRIVINALENNRVELGKWIAELTQQENEMNTVKSETVDFGVMLPAPFVDYSVTEDGKVFSHKFGRVKELAQVRNSANYFNVNVVVESKKRYVTVHSLVALAFHGPRPQGNVIRHLDGNQFNNHKDNLAYGTQAENMQDAVRHGTVRFGENHHSAKLKDADIPDLRLMRERGFTYREIGEAFNISLSRAHVLCNKEWRFKKQS